MSENLQFDKNFDRQKETIQFALNVESIQSLQKQLCDKDTEMSEMKFSFQIEKKQLEIKLDELNSRVCEKEKLIQELLGYKKDYQMLKADNDAVRKLAIEYTGQLHAQVEKSNSEIVRLKHEIIQQQAYMLDLKEEYDNQDKQIKELEEKCKTINAYNERVIAANEQLQEKLCAYEAASSKSYLDLFKTYYKEMHSCKAKLTNLFENCQKISEKKPLNPHKLFANGTITNVSNEVAVDSKFIDSAIENVKFLNKILDRFEHLIMQLYLAVLCG